MSIELAEARILSTQMNRQLKGKQIKSYQLQNYEKLQKIGMINKDPSAFSHLTNRKITSVTSRGNTILVKLDNNMNLLVGPEYGGIIIYHTKKETIPSKLHLLLEFTDTTLFTVTLTGMGIIQALNDDELKGSYLYKRDFSQAISPLDNADFTLERFSHDLSSRNVNIKQALVGKDAVIVGFSNSAYQDAIYRARIHPKRKANSLNENEKHALYDSIRFLIEERLKLGGKNQFTDLYNKQGCYVPRMGPNMKDQACPRCGTKIEAISLGGGQTFFCPKCQT
jgi:formamidopyrimidine-DNA glycosylase